MTPNRTNISRRWTVALAGTAAAISGAFVTATAVADTGNIPETAVASGRLDTLVAAVQAAGLAEALSGPGPLTVFAPTDAAFARLGEETLSSLLTDAGRPTLVRILKNHVVAGRFEARDLVDREGIETLAGTNLPLAAARGRLFVDEAVVETADVSASNGIVHLIDRVLVPARQVSPMETLLEIAVSRGAPLYNEGNIDACAEVYATALDAVSLSGDFGLDDKGRANLASRLKEIAGESTSRDRAWAYRRIIDSLFADGMTMQPTSAAAKPAGRG
ncbi:MAG: fasciclin domain-containing protein, partial [Phycisphaerales bacterium]|nr:fasciclin domain-containing protein [Phycisphaerales bacterium]